MMTGGQYDELRGSAARKHVYAMHARASSACNVVTRRQYSGDVINATATLAGQPNTARELGHASRERKREGDPSAHGLGRLPAEIRTAALLLSEALYNLRATGS